MVDLGQRKWRGTPHSPNLQSLTLTIRLFNIISRALICWVGGGLTPQQRCIRNIPQPWLCCNPWLDILVRNIPCLSLEVFIQFFSSQFLLARSCCFTVCTWVLFYRHCGYCLQQSILFSLIKYSPRICTVLSTQMVVHPLLTLFLDTFSLCYLSVLRRAQSTGDVEYTDCISARG